jgi:hypothetical protein|tara:strand:- start:172 stop:558 length:387 start_codon:yes stop_codon:yes gene_type:complete
MEHQALDKLNTIFHMRDAFMKEMRNHIPEAQPDLPVNLGDKEGQQYCRDLALRGVEEMFEALQHLKNWKTHRLTEMPDFDRDKFLEEVVDAFNYFFSLLRAVDCDADEFFDAYVKKDKIIHERIKKKY